ncbi:MAG TPA: hypothetical protein VJH68_04520 [Candidatus Nanoarchaeia archaeon]|nr:hypothetical protein [Candidatus Nanoarchaeia archaeon]
MALEKKGQSWLASGTLMTIIIAVLIGLTVLFFIFKLRGSLG